MRIFFLSTLSAVILFSNPAIAQNAKVLQSFKDWTAYVHESSGNKICFAASKPKQTLPTNVRRGDILFYISTWPKEGVRNEISVKIGYPFKADSVTTAEIGSEKFELFTKNDKAFIELPEDEARLVESMKKGSTMVIKGTSSRGTLTTDSYSLLGISAALDRINKECQ